MITPEQARQDYQTAITALSKIASAFETEPAARSAARAAAQELTLNYLNSIEVEIQALSAQYQAFIAALNEVIPKISGATTPASALGQLTNLVQTGSQLIQTVANLVPPGARGLRAPAAAPAGPASIKILCVHGVGHQENDPQFEQTWRDAATKGLQAWNVARPFEIQFVAYDRLFAASSLTAADLAAAVFKLTASGIVHGIGDLFRKPRGFEEVPNQLRWTAGMVAQWAENDKLRAAACDAVRAHLNAFQPDAILAHSLGSLICYDLFNNPKDAALLSQRVFVTLGSQIGNPFVRDALGGRVEALRSAQHWFHLYNLHDDAFAAPLRLRADNFEQVTTTFDIPGMLDHDAIQYLQHPNTIASVWRSIAQDSPVTGAVRAFSASTKALKTQVKLVHQARVQSKPSHRALLVGINEYPDPANRLEGCVNDVFLMSSVLQECGFEAENIRVVLNDRATSTGVMERLEWLLDGAQDGQNRVLFYSGHGAQLPAYGPDETADHLDECLVTYDFDWSREHAVTDKQFYELYSQLPDAAHFLAVFDCCHSGGLTREGGLRVRGLTPPDDIRHRALKWNVELQMWENRLVPAATGGKAASGQPPGAVLCKLGRTSHVKCNNAYAPILLEACQESQFSYEYRHGAIAYGAFTFSLAQTFRQARQELLLGKRTKLPSWKQLTDTVTAGLRALKYDQKPELVCPPGVQDLAIPWVQKQKPTTSKKRK